VGSAAALAASAVVASVALGVVASVAEVLGSNSSSNSNASTNSEAPHQPLVVPPALVVPPGSGKSTCMHILGCLDVPTSGRYLLAGTDVSKMDEEQLAHVRNRRIGFVFQQFHLLSHLSAWRNSRSSADVLAMLDGLHRSGRTIVLITHEQDVAEAAERIMRFRDGRFVGQAEAAA
jgi:ABC-type lipoprotein export system ATPase subunit